MNIKEYREYANKNLNKAISNMASKAQKSNAADDFNNKAYQRCVEFGDRIEKMIDQLTEENLNRNIEHYKKVVWFDRLEKKAHDETYEELHYG